MSKTGIPFLFLSALVSLSVLPLGASDAQAATITGLAATTSTPLQHGQPNASPIVLNFTLPTALIQNQSDPNYIIVNVQRVSTSVLTSSVTDTSAYFSSNPAGVGGFGLTYFGTQANSQIPNYTQFITNFGGITAGTNITMTIAAGTLTMPNSGNISLEVSSFDYNDVPLDSATTMMTISGSSSTVTFNANGGSGTMSNQTSSSAASLTANTFTRTGYTFGGWASSQVNATAGTVAYADGASYPFTSSATLYAIWTANGSGGGSGTSGASSGSGSLATTGFDASIPAGVAGLLVVAGAALTIIRRRHAG